jgi:hypothetical protein
MSCKWTFREFSFFPSSRSILTTKTGEVTKRVVGWSPKKILVHLFAFESLNLRCMDVRILRLVSLNRVIIDLRRLEGTYHLHCQCLRDPKTRLGLLKVWKWRQYVISKRRESNLLLSTTILKIWNLKYQCCGDLNSYARSRQSVDWVTPLFYAGVVFLKSGRKLKWRN